MKDIDVRHPRKNDVLGRRFTIAGIGTAFEGTVGWQLQVGDEIVQQGSLQGGSMGLLGEFVGTITLDAGDQATAAKLLVYGDNPALPDEGPAPGTSLNTIPVVLVPGAQGLINYEVRSGDTLTSIAKDSGYGTSSVEAIVVANADLIAAPDHIEVGWTIRVPVS